MKENPMGLIAQLERLSGCQGNRPNTGAMAILRRGIGHRLTDIDPAVMPYIAPHIGSKQGAALPALVATLYAQHPQHEANRESLGSRLAKAIGSDSQERRIQSLLHARGDEQIARLREAIALLASAGQSLDYVQLYWDLNEWESSQRKVQIRWARDFWCLRHNLEIPTENHKNLRTFFILHLNTLATRNDRAALADLRSGLDRPGEAIRLLPHVAPFLPPERPWEWNRWLLIASLFGLHPHHREKEIDSLPKAWYILMQQSNQKRSESQEQRFIALLDAESTELGHHLRQAVSLLKQANMPLNYSRLLNDILFWGSGKRRVQLQWAKNFWG